MEENLFTIEGEEDYQKGLLYFKGSVETPVDVRKSFEYFNRAASVGHSEAKFQVGYLYLYGEPNILKNEKRAMQCLKSAADDGIAIAQFYCGIGYFCGNGIEKNVEVGIDYFKKSAKQGYYPAADFLAEIYLTGTEVEKDINKAKMYNDQARVQGNQNAEIRSIRIMVSPK
ncbi:MAG: sel1 repeat family protein [Lachnospiraceae bacterium]|nr:sel1 repeat family protein [Lachnospiraceae bacterium]